MDDLGTRSSYLTLEPGARVLAADGTEVGSVAHVLAAEEEDLFEGLVVDTAHGPRYADESVIGDVYQRGVVLTLDAAEAARLPEPTAEPPAMSTGPDDTVDAKSDLGSRLRRAWDLISGRY